MKTVFALIIITIISIVSYSQNTSLYLNLEKGKEYKLVSKYKSTPFLDSIYDCPKTISGIVSILFLVTDITDKGYEVVLKYNIGEQLNESNFQDLTAYMYQKINNKPLHATMSKAGKILEVKNLDSIIDTLVEENKHVPKESKEYAKKWLIESHFNPKRMNDNLILVYPDYPVSKGDTWTILVEFESGNPSKMSTVYEITEITSDFAIIKSSTKFERIDDNTFEKYFSMQIKFNVTVTSITEMKVDLHTGWIIDAKIYSEQNGVMYLKNSSKDTKIEKLPYCVLKEVAITN